MLGLRGGVWRVVDHVAGDQRVTREMRPGQDILAPSGPAFARPEGPRHTGGQDLGQDGTRYAGGVGRVLDDARLPAASPWASTTGSARPRPRSLPAEATLAQRSSSALMNGSTA